MIKIEGIEELTRRFKALEEVGQRKVLAVANKARAQLARDRAAQLAPKDTGLLAANLAVRQKAKSGATEALTDIGTGKGQFYGRHQEFGTGTGFEAAAARALGFKGRSRSNRRNAASQPFIRPAIEQTAAAGIAAIERELQRAITKAENA